VSRNAAIKVKPASSGSLAGDSITHHGCCRRCQLQVVALLQVLVRALLQQVVASSLAAS
jgi:hypothetical protein